MTKMIQFTIPHVKEAREGGELFLDALTDFQPVALCRVPSRFAACRVVSTASHEISSLLLAASRIAKDDDASGTLQIGHRGGS